MASPSWHNSNNESLFVSQSPEPPQLPSIDSFRSPQHQWDSRPSAPLRNPSFTLPPPVPSLQRNNSHPQPDPTLYQNHYFQRQSSGGQAGNSRQQSGQEQGRQQPQAQNYQPQPYLFNQQHNQQQSFSDQQLEPQLPSLSSGGATNGHLTPSRFDLPNGENYLTSTPEGGWNLQNPNADFDFDALLGADYGDGLDLISTGSQQSNSQSNQNSHNNNSGGGNNIGGGNNSTNNQLPEFDLFHPNHFADPFALPGPAPNYRPQKARDRREQRQLRFERQRAQRAQEEREVFRNREERREEEAVDLTHTSPTMPPRGTKRSAPATGAAGSTRNGTAAGRTSRNTQSPPSNSGISPPPAKRAKTQSQKEKDDTLHDLFGSPDAQDEVDLVGVNDDTSYEEAAKKRKEEEAQKKRKQEQEKPIRLAEQQCVICLDQPDGLTVTHCGHMFCAECLHGALNTNIMGKKVCPVCRSNINTTRKKKPGQADGPMPRTGIYHMEMKLQTRRQGKQAQRS